MIEVPIECSDCVHDAGEGFITAANEWHSLRVVDGRGKREKMLHAHFLTLLTQASTPHQHCDHISESGTHLPSSRGGKVWNFVIENKENVIECATME
jgi:hypothetical protein